MDGELNTNLAETEGSSLVEEIAVEFVTTELEDMYAHFFLCHKY